MADRSSPQGYGTSFKGADGKPLCKTAAAWLHAAPDETRQHLEYVHARYRPPAIVVTGSCCSFAVEEAVTLSQALNDTFRVDYFRSQVERLAEAVRSSGVPVRGYFAWSLLDGFEWAEGYHARFGITYVDRKTQQRYPKESARWFQSLLERVRRGTSAPCTGDMAASITAWRWCILGALPGLVCAFIIARMWFVRNCRQGSKKQRRLAKQPTAEPVAPSSCTTTAAVTKSTAQEPTPALGMSLWSDRVPSFIYRLRDSKQATAEPESPPQISASIARTTNPVQDLAPPKRYMMWPSQLTSFVQLKTHPPGYRPLTQVFTGTGSPSATVPATAHIVTYRQPVVMATQTVLPPPVVQRCMHSGKA